MFTTPIARRLRVPGYLIMVMMIVAPAVDLLVRAWPFRGHSVAWRLGFVSTAVPALTLGLLGFYAMCLIAILAEDRVMAYIVATVSGLMSVACVAAVGIFSLDVLQMKGQIPEAQASQYGVGSAWLIVRLCVSVVLFILLAVATFRAARGLSTRQLAATGRKGAVLINTSRPAASAAAPRAADIDSP